jgi:hypothetical protein
MEKSIRILLIVTGVHSNQIIGHSSSMEEIQHKEMKKN